MIPTMPVASRWSDKACRAYFPTDTDFIECATCGWLENEHKPKIAESIQAMSKVTLDSIMEAINQLTEQVQALTEQQAEIVEKLANLSLENDGFSFEDD